MLSQNHQDFIVGSNGHAGLSNRKAAELLRVHSSSIDELTRGAGFFSESELEFIAAYGFQGAGLVKLATRFAKSDRVKAETRKHCLDLLEKAAIIGAQTFIDKMAGIDLTPSQQPQLLPEQRLQIGMNALQFFSIDQTNPRYAQGLQDWCLNLMLGQKQLPESTERWLGVAERAEELGYGRIGADLSLRTRLGTFVSKCDLERKREERLCNGTQRKIWIYRVCDELDAVIVNFFEAQP